MILYVLYEENVNFAGDFPTGNVPEEMNLFASDFRISMLYYKTWISKQ
jgi:hypothetical protein